MARVKFFVLFVVLLSYLVDNVLYCDHLVEKEGAGYFFFFYLFIYFFYFVIFFWLLFAVFIMTSLVVYVL